MAGDRRRRLGLRRRPARFDVGNGLPGRRSRAAVRAGDPGRPAGRDRLHHPLCPLERGACALSGHPRVAQLGAHGAARRPPAPRAHHRPRPGDACPADRRGGRRAPARRTGGVHRPHHHLARRSARRARGGARSRLGVRARTGHLGRGLCIRSRRLPNPRHRRGELLDAGAAGRPRRSESGGRRDRRTHEKNGSDVAPQRNPVTATRIRQAGYRTRGRRLASGSGLCPSRVRRRGRSARRRRLRRRLAGGSRSLRRPPATTSAGCCG